jgi:hypothetical protein
MGQMFTLVHCQVYVKLRVAPTTNCGLICEAQRDRGSGGSSLTLNSDRHQARPVAQVDLEFKCR